MWEELQRYFHELTALPIDEREPALVRLCRDDPDLGRRLRALLESDRQFEDTKMGNLGTIASDFKAQHARLWVGSHIGPYRLKGCLGEGGMGTVFHATRTDGQFEQEVAIKLIKRGNTTGLWRFLDERQIMATLQHPNVASLLDGGVTDDGRPYFVMEYIDGVPLTEYCNQKKLRIAERVSLFLQVCDAVRYLHQNLIVHRDLKPSNILVRSDGSAKILDFGIAKILAQESSYSSGESTRTGVRVMTPRYASPEQVTGDPITTATDVYALGLLLCELLVGALPFDFDEGNWFKTEQAIVSQPAIAPSQLLDRVQADAVAASRTTTRRGLRKQLRGDLDAICLKALRKEPHQRYASAEGIRHDLECVLEGLPVQARSGRWSYHTWKFLRRHRFAVTIAAAFMALLIGFSATTWTQSRQIKREAERTARERDKAQEVARFLHDLFIAADPEEQLGQDIKARELLDRGAARIESEMRANPVLQGEMMRLIGGIYLRLGLVDPSRELFEKSRDIATEPLERAVSLVYLAEALIEAADFEQARDCAAQALEIARDRDAVATRARATLVLAKALKGAGDLKIAEPHYTQALGLFESLGKESESDLVRARNDYGSFLVKLERYDQATEIHSRNLDAKIALFGPRHPSTARTLVNLGVALRLNGQTEEGVTQLERGMEIMSGVYGEDSVQVAHVLNNLAGSYRQLGRYGDAREAYHRASVLLEQFYGEQHPKVLTLRHNLAVLLVSGLQDYEAAAPILRDVVVKAEALLGDRHPFVVTAMSTQAAVLAENGEVDRAEKLYRHVIEARSARYDESHSLVTSARRMYGLFLMRQERYQQAEAELIQALELSRSGEHPVRATVALHQNALAQLYARTGSYTRALSLATSALDVFVAEKNAPSRIGSTQSLMGWMLFELGRIDDALESLESGLVHNRPRQGVADPERLLRRIEQSAAGNPKLIERVDKLRQNLGQP